MCSRQVSSFNIPPPCDTNLLTPISTAGSPPLHQLRKLMGHYPPPPGSPQTQEPTPPGSSKMYHQWNNQFDMNGQPSSTSSPMATPAHVAPESFYMTDERRTPGPPEPYMGMFGVSDSAADPGHISNTGPPYYIDVSQMGNQNPMMVRDNPPMPVDPHHRDIVAGNSRVKKTRSSKRQSGTPRNSQQPDPSEEHKNCNGEEVPPRLKGTCPEEERCIFESRWRHRHQRGQDMWDSIQEDFTKRFNKSHGKEMLQMKFKRARSKYIEWLPRDEDILREAWKRMERDRYQTLLDLFVEMGGSRNMRLNSSDIEVKVVNDLKLEEHLYMESYRDMDVRRRRKVSAKKRTNGPHDDMPGADDLMGVDPRTTHNEEDVINQVHGRREPMRWETDSPAHSTEMMDMPVWDSRAPMKLDAAPGLRLVNGVNRSVYPVPK
ncbi:Copper transport protein ctr4 [Purpureocillium lavendulum]|uniref:Copper transport protein ctr4 n=1 Tax=Purpureocillium lavendulum TaxID=1247861 RepID=A0AB34FUQ8_9HYPO|nr:Copper transport protein ctr4 [Purpureocillium lavendulum]